MSTHSSRLSHVAAGRNRENEELDKRLALLFWPLLFILAGSLWLFPEGRVLGGAWLIGIGFILLALNAVRMLKGIPVRVLPSFLGALALASGLAEYAGMKLPILSLTLMVIGASIILELLATPHRSPR